VIIKLKHAQGGFFGYYQLEYMINRDQHFDRHIALLFPDYEKGKDVRYLITLARKAEGEAGVASPGGVDNKGSERVQQDPWKRRRELRHNSRLLQLHGGKCKRELTVVRVSKPRSRFATSSQVSQ
jgi:hypothetical protein